MAETRREESCFPAVSKDSWSLYIDKISNQDVILQDHDSAIKVSRDHTKPIVRSPDERFNNNKKIITRYLPLLHEMRVLTRTIP